MPAADDARLTRSALAKYPVQIFLIWYPASVHVQIMRFCFMLPIFSAWQYVPSAGWLQ